jgi:hypothetical protein
MMKSNLSPANRSTLDYASNEARGSSPLSAGNVALALSVSFFVAGPLACLGFGEGELIALVLILPVGGLLLGIASGRRRRRQPAPPGERRAARAAIVLSGLQLALIFAATLILPTLGRPREPAHRIKCASNLRQIGQSIQIYASENKGAFPPSFDELLMTGDLTSEVFVCPTSNDTAARAATTQAMIQQWREPGHLSYVYVPPLPGVTAATITANHVLAYEAMSHHGGDGMNVLYGDIHVDWIPNREAAHILAELQAGYNPPRPVTTQTSPAATAGKPAG